MAYTKDELNSILADLQSYWTLRKNQMIKRWDFYYGEMQRYYAPMFPGESVDEYNLRAQTSIIENHCAKTCDVVVAYLYGQPNAKGRTAVRVVDKAGKMIQEYQELFEDNIWDYNDIDSFRVDMALMASVTGFALVYKEFVDKETGLPFPDNTPNDDKAKRGTVRYELFDSVDTTPIPRIASSSIGDRVVYPRLLGGVLRYYSLDNYYGGSYFDRLLGRRLSIDNHVELFDDENIWYGKIPTGGPIESVMELKNIPNPYGRVDTPFTLVRNYGDPMYLEGDSDLGQMIDLQIALNQLSNDDIAAITYHSFPLMFLKGAKLPPNFVKKVNSAIEIPADADIGYAVWQNALVESNKKQEDIRRNMSTASGIGELSRGGAANVGQVRSGAGLKVLFQGDINEIALKIPMFKKAEKELVNSTLRLWSFHTGQALKEYYVEVDFPQDFVGMDELLSAQTTQIELTEGIRTLREVIKGAHPDITSEAELDAYIAQMMRERQQMAVAGAPPKVPGAQSSSSRSAAQSGA